MGPRRSLDSAALARTRTAVGSSLRARGAELKRAALAKVLSVSDAGPDAEYAAGLRSAVATALDCGLEVLEGSNAGTVAMPAPLLIQARFAARAGVALDVVVRRYTAGHALLNDAVAEAVAAVEPSAAGALHQLLRDQATLFDRVIDAVSEEYRAEVGRQGAPANRNALLVRKLLAGDLVDPAELPYDISAWHLGVVASGPEAGSLLRGLAEGLDRRLILVDGGEGTIWAWFGGLRRIGSAQLERAASTVWPDGAYLGIGEPAQSLPGWRATHRQARAVVPLARRGGQRVTRYADNALLSSIFHDELLIDSMRQLYLEPLDGEHDRGGSLRRTLEAYFAAQGNLSSAASALGVTRKTVATRLRRVEERLGRSLASCSFEVEAALALDRMIGGE
jgi:PucR C-terminal helix-turn-helix domain